MLNAICYVNGNLDDDTIRGMRVEDDDYKILVSQQVMIMMTCQCDDDGHDKHKVMIRQMTI